MSIKSLLNQTVTVYSSIGKDKYGKDLDGSAVDYSGRFEYQSTNVVLPNGQVITIDAVVYFNSDVLVSIGDRVDYGGERYRVFGKSAPVDMSGNTHHIKLKLTKWV